MDFAAILDGEQTEKKRGKVAKVPAPATQSFNIETVKKHFLVYSSEIEKMVAKAEGHEVKDQPSLEEAVAMGTAAKQLFKKIDGQRKATVDDPSQFVRTVNNFAKTFTDRLKKIEDSLKKKISDHNYRVELERREQERKAREAAEKLQAQLDEEAKEKQVEPVKIPVPVVPEPEHVTRTETGASHQRMKWMFEVEDENKIPREYLQVNEAKIRQAIAMGRHEIPGLRIYEKAVTVFRT